MSNQNHYEKNRERIKTKNRTYYHKKKETDPEFYDKVLKRNQTRYHKSIKPACEMTQEEKNADEAQMYRIMKWVRENREDDEMMEKKRVRKLQRRFPEPPHESDPHLMEVLRRAFAREQQADLSLSFI